MYRKRPIKCRGRDYFKFTTCKVYILLMALSCGSGWRWSRVVKMTFCLFLLIPMSSVGNRNTNTIFNKKQKLEVRQQLKRLNKPALKSIVFSALVLEESFTFVGCGVFTSPMYNSSVILLQHWDFRIISMYVCWENVYDTDPGWRYNRLHRFQQAISFWSSFVKKSHNSSN